MSAKVKVIRKQRVAEIDYWVKFKFDTDIDVVHQIQKLSSQCKEDTKESVYEV